MNFLSKLFLTVQLRKVKLEKDDILIVEVGNPDYIPTEQNLIEIEKLLDERLKGIAKTVVLTPRNIKIEGIKDWLQLQSPEVREAMTTALKEIKEREVLNFNDRCPACNVGV